MILVQEITTSWSKDDTLLDSARRERALNAEDETKDTLAAEPKQKKGMAEKA